MNTMHKANCDKFLSEQKRPINVLFAYLQESRAVGVEAESFTQQLHHRTDQGQHQHRHDYHQHQTQQHHHPHQQRQQVYSCVTVRPQNTEVVNSAANHTHQPVQVTVHSSQDGRHNAGLGPTLDRKPTHNGTEDRKWRSRVKPASYYLTGKSDDVVKPEVMSHRKQHVTEVGVADSRVAKPSHNGEYIVRGSEGKLLERRLASTAGVGGVMEDHLKQLRISIDRFQTIHSNELQATELHQNENYNNSCGSSPSSRQMEQIATSHRELNGPQTPLHMGQTSGQTTPLRVDVVKSKFRNQSRSTSPSTSSATSYPSSPVSNSSHLGGRQNGPPAWSPLGQQSQDGHVIEQPQPQLMDKATRRQIEYEAGLRRFGPNHMAQHSGIGEDDRQQVVSQRGMQSGCL